MAKAPKQVKVSEIRPLLLNLHSTAEALDLSYKTVCNMRSAGTFPLQAVRFGGKPFYVYQEVRELVDRLPRESE